MNTKLTLAAVLGLACVSPSFVWGTEAKFDPAVEVTIRSSKDAAEQKALMYVPAKADPDADKPEATPLVVCLHSWSTGYKTAHYMPEILQHCTQRGWIFVSPDYRGPNRRPEACASDLAVQDVLDSVAFAKRRARVDEKRIYLVGGSGGGHMALVMAHRAPKLWAGVSSWVPITDLTEWYRFCKARDYRYWKMMEKCCGGPPGTPKTDAQYKRRSPLFELGKAKGLPIDISAGIRDGHGGASVPIRHSLLAFNVLAKANGQAEKTLSDDDIAVLADKARIPDHLAQQHADEPGRKYKALFRRTAGPAQLTLFDGAHELDAEPAIRWLATTSKRGGGTTP